MQYDPSTNPLNSNEWSFPLVEIIHIASFAMSIGMIALVDLRMLGAGLRKMTPSQLVKSTDLWTQMGLLLAVMSGIVLWTTDPANYLRNPAFRFKLGCLALAIVYNFTVHRKVAGQADCQPAEGCRPAVRLAAMVSIVLWLSVVFSGIFYGFV